MRRSRTFRSTFPISPINWQQSRPRCPSSQAFEAAPAAEASNAYASDNAYSYEPTVIEQVAPVAVEPAFEPAPAAVGQQRLCVGQCLLVRTGSDRAGRCGCGRAEQQITPSMSFLPISSGFRYRLRPAWSPLQFTLDPAIYARAEPAVVGWRAPVKKSPYPFTPTFSRATPVASRLGCRPAARLCWSDRLVDRLLPQHL